MSSYLWSGSSSTAWATGANWSPSGPPSTSGDSAYFDGTCTQGLASSNQSATTLALLEIYSSFAFTIGSIGSPMQVGATQCRIGDSQGVSGTGSGRITLDFGTIQTNVYVTSTSNASTDIGKPSVRLKGANSSNVATVASGSVGFAVETVSDTATFGTIAITGSGASVTIGAGMTLTTLLQSAGTTVMYSGATNVYVEGGTLTVNGAGAIAAAQVAGYAYLQSSGTITTLSVYSGGTADFSGSAVPRTVTTLYAYKGATIIYDPAIITFTNPPLVPDGQVNDVSWQTPNGVSVAIAKT